LFTRTGFIVEELGGKMAAAFVKGGASNFFKGDSGLSGELVDYCPADFVFGKGRVSYFETGPVNVDLGCGGKVEVFAYAESEEVLLAVQKAFN
jgi:hypothetical protein